MNCLARIGPLIAALAFGGISLAGEAWARPAPGVQSEAEERYDRGVELFKEGDYRAALIEFERAYDLAPNYRVLYNIGQVHYMLKDYAKALAVLSQYLEEGGDRLSSKRTKSVEADIAKLQPRVALLEIQVDAAGAEVLVDDVAVGITPLDAPLSVSAGRRKVTVIAPNQEPVTKFVDVAGSEDAAVSFELGSGGSDSTGGEDLGESGDGSTDDADSGSTDYTWIGWAVTGALSVSSMITGGLALSAAGDLDEARQRQTTTEELDDLSSKTLSLSVATDVLAGGAVVAAVVTTIVLLVGDSGDDAASDAAFRIEPAPAPGGAGLRLLF
ncbi:MAG: tetratricopeptide repeat protein [Deltaproteobacteria bacterium]|jgi:hypothetical protein|nr:tetratricopeptide repeat protein [Deltaproteobacteria bacterium]MBW2531519.1 tetratricopeptide repeat protein [Deltaproteobacteria bacterium]